MPRRRNTREAPRILPLSLAADDEVHLMLALIAYRDTCRRDHLTCLPMVDRVVAQVSRQVTRIRRAQMSTGACHRRRVGPWTQFLARHLSSFRAPTPRPLVKTDPLRVAEIEAEIAGCFDRYSVAALALRGPL